LGALLPRNGQPEQEYQAGSKALSSACDQEGREDRTSSERGEKKHRTETKGAALGSGEKLEPSQHHESGKTKMEQDPSDLTSA
jgi:hypothetical protein